jgi:hypothetical protein
MGERAGREAEIEAVIRALVAEGCGSGWAAARAPKIIGALDAVRSRSLGHDFGPGRGPDSCNLCGLPRSAHAPQGEDHEAGIEAAAKEYGWADGEDVARRLVAAYLSRVSPSPERDTVRRIAEWLREPPTYTGLRQAANAIEHKFLAEFLAAPKADEQEQG